MDDNGYIVNIHDMDNVDIDPRAQRTAILHGIATVLMDLIDFSSSSENEDSEDEEVEYVMQLMEKRKKLPRLENYVENIVPAYSNQQFKSHFR